MSLYWCMLKEDVAGDHKQRRNVVGVKFHVELQGRNFELRPQSSVAFISPTGTRSADAD
jgi:hypothetical protein